MLETGKGIFLLLMLGFAAFIAVIAVMHALEGPPPKETTYVTLVFIDKDKVKGVLGIGGINSTITMRGSETYHQMQFRVVNGDDEPHQLVIEGIASTKLLEPGDLDTLMLSGGEYGKYKYYDAITNTTLGEFWILRVSALDDM
ncbi:MAG: hypothetical protein KatS3mg003_0955 [Candidatus Nitrosocaldaceae archaeon]|nr:MAG: hypothetical protein KatS3mg003_0955 [Candidatus Nitrosocaldaceae archaeon]